MFSLNPLLGIGACLAVMMVMMAGLSYEFPYGVNISEAPLGLYIGVALLSSGAWFLLPREINRSRATRMMFVATIFIGLVMRGSLFLSLPVMEDDSYRYFWDGAVTANGLDPYKYAPADVATNSPLIDTDDDAVDADLVKLQSLSIEHSEQYHRINYPYVSTIYPPLTQAAFAAAYHLDPFGMNGWRLVLLVTDLIILLLLVKLLTANRRDPLWALLYWWNPVVVLQSLGAGHMDLLILPFLLSAVLLAQQRKVNGAVIALAGAAAIKLWPAILFPMVARSLLRQPAKLVLTSGLFCGILILALLPQLFHVLDPAAGLNAYANSWRTHAFLFAVLEDFVLRGFDEPGLMARTIVMASIIALTAYLAFRRAHDLNQLPVLCAIVISTLILLSPTGYPWYLIWLAPFLAFVPNAGLCGLFLTAPLYWLRFELGEASSLYQWGVVPIAFGLPILLLFFSYQKTRPDH